jgi:enoyl reductase-like protein
LIEEPQRRLLKEANGEGSEVQFVLKACGVVNSREVEAQVAHEYVQSLRNVGAEGLDKAL